MQNRPRIVVIGAGIIGSAITYNLALRGADVFLTDKGAQPGSGVTGRAFGWINVINGTPGESHYQLWRDAVEEYRHLKESLPAAFFGARSGSFLWKATVEETETFAALHQQAGISVELMHRSTLHGLEPRLRRLPDIAAFSPDDMALDPAQLARNLVAAAVELGASTRFGVPIGAIETSNGQVSGVNIDGETLPADIVILAAGAGVQHLIQPLGIETGLTTSPAQLLRYACSQLVINHILRSPTLEVRQASDNTLLVAKSYVFNGKAGGPEFIGATMHAIMKEELYLPDDVTLTSAEIGERPVFDDGLPRIGALPEVGNLYIAVGHPGVILAPLIGRIVAQQILGD